jgi:membrane associated rhomboid family serine protease
MLPLKDENPTRRLAVITFLLIALNTAAFIYEVGLPPHLRADLVLRRGLIPAAAWGVLDLPAGAIVRTFASFFTYMFIHGDLFHLLGNMLFLWIFADNVEDKLGRGRFVLFYGLCGLVAAATQIAALPQSRIPMVGASGAISGVLGAYILLFPRARVVTVVPIFIFLHFMKLPAFFVLGVWFLFQVLHSALADPARGGVAWYAHIGGFVAGMVLLPLFLPRRSPAERRPREADWI